MAKIDMKLETKDLITKIKNSKNIDDLKNCFDFMINEFSLSSCFTNDLKEILNCLINDAAEKMMSFEYMNPDSFSHWQNEILPKIWKELQEVSKTKFQSFEEYEADGGESREYDELADYVMVSYYSDWLVKKESFITVIETIIKLYQERI